MENSIGKTKVSVGSWITVPHPTIVELMSSFDFDWLCIDLEHSPVSYLELQNAIQIIQGKGKKAYVRVPLNSHYHTKFPLDAGPDGIIIPMVNSKKEAMEAVQHCFYPPKGKRSVGLARAHKFGFDFNSHYNKNIHELDLIVQVEHVNAVEEIDEILSVQEIAGVFIGPYDLSSSLGIPGQLDHPRLLECIKIVEKKALLASKKLGMHIIQPDSSILESNIENGYNFLAFSIDTLFLGHNVQNQLRKIKR
ncbi:2,4-dihydroxyhept-2-ene-1,7-dioic acid aldolase [Silvanigrella paludirubra]|uniref:2,4-dihydroxyhept-2-ene-1,7-dioic acid aldolase n=1 Tax=Silvanigrella paludirubra TaxID=2499159 RepID=A0A6N6VQ55_9BACT|nr:aldolase/citrate lyase family protein [Silvanigrella paludirubra]KAB8036817.1 2,4-dihydroxyhept-2-ene-1,7-dioic acid aldolase [Silvanigrella paludirubra]